MSEPVRRRRKKKKSGNAAYVIEIILVVLVFVLIVILFYSKQSVEVIIDVCEMLIHCIEIIIEAGKILIAFLKGMRHIIYQFKKHVKDLLLLVSEGEIACFYESFKKTDLFKNIHIYALPIYSPVRVSI